MIEVPLHELQRHECHGRMRPLLERSLSLSLSLSLALSPSLKGLVTCCLSLTTKPSCSTVWLRGRHVQQRFERNMPPRALMLLHPLPGTPNGMPFVSLPACEATGTPNGMITNNFSGMLLQACEAICRFILWQACSAAPRTQHAASRSAPASPLLSSQIRYLSQDSKYV